MQSIFIGGFGGNVILVGGLRARKRWAWLFLKKRCPDPISVVLPPHKNPLQGRKSTLHKGGFLYAKQKFTTPDVTLGQLKNCTARATIHLLSQRTKADPPDFFEGEFLPDSPDSTRPTRSDRDVAKQQINQPPKGGGELRAVTGATITCGAKRPGGHETFVKVGLPGRGGAGVWLRETPQASSFSPVGAKGRRRNKRLLGLKEALIYTRFLQTNRCGRHLLASPGHGPLLGRPPPKENLRVGQIFLPLTTCPNLKPTVGVDIPLAKSLLRHPPRFAGGSILLRKILTMVAPER
ncbi:hypothetical protein RRG08_015265 [Elysia crispata]|uniref:Uncharacterized protein n=1 Tax=Elysia crispata TaxID=231223 RepID=A0AAE1E5C1_9GAST|nr:hypothetical protein RRG08_015265 [Elysia crispata]